MNGFSVKLPLSISPDGGFTSNKTIPQTVKQNLKNLFLTNPGERIMDPAFGIGLKRFLFEQNENHMHTILKKKISEQVGKYMPFISIEDMLIETDENALFLTFKYIITPLAQSDQIDLSVKI